LKKVTGRYKIRRWCVKLANSKLLSFEVARSLRW
jgi:hypothetical protein